MKNFLDQFIKHEHQKLKTHKVQCQTTETTTEEYYIEKKKCCCTCSLRTGTLFIAIFHLISLLVWVYEIIDVYVTIPNKIDTHNYSNVYIAITNGIVTLIGSFFIFISYCLKNQILLLVSSIMEIILTACMIITSILLFMYGTWTVSFTAIVLAFFFFYSTSVINSYRDELRQITHLIRPIETLRKKARY